YHSQSATAALQDGSGTVTVHGDQWRGYGFAGDSIDVRWHAGLGRRLAVGAGHFYCVGTLASNLSKSGTATMNVAGGGSITVYGQWGDSDSGATIGALWNERQQRWDASLESCS